MSSPPVAILFAARKSAYGSEYKFKNICSTCATINEIEVSIDDVKVKGSIIFIDHLLD